MASFAKIYLDFLGYIVVVVIIDVLGFESCATLGNFALDEEFNVMDHDLISCFLCVNTYV
jgi:hypothetical protein